VGWQIKSMCVRVMVNQVGNYHMGYMEEGDNRIAFMYRLVKGITKRSFGLNVALLAKLPKEIVDRAGDMSKRLESQVSLVVTPHVKQLLLLLALPCRVPRAVTGHAEPRHSMLVRCKKRYVSALRRWLARCSGKLAAPRQVARTCPRSLWRFKAKQNSFLARARSFSLPFVGSSALQREPTIVAPAAAFRHRPGCNVDTHLAHWRMI
jgi:hypothetical protein